MASDLETIKRAIGKVLNRSGNRDTRVGTAFFVGGKHVLTALHVVADVRGLRPVFLDGLRLEFGEHATDARVVDDFWDAQGDWAVLECTSPPSVPPIKLRKSPLVGDEHWHSFAYPDIQPDGKTFKGGVDDPNAKFRAAHAIELSCEEAKAGLGARLHGSSGAPCLVGDEAIGLLRSTLTETLVDGEGRRQVFTQAGAVYACPAAAVVAWQANKARSILEDTWAPARIAVSDFIVFLSQAEHDPKANPLKSVVKQAFKRIRDTDLSPPEFDDALNWVASKENLLDAVRALCHARVVIFDATDFEPAIMLLAGIRAVVRRGVTILSIGGNYTIGGQLDIPFNVADANVVAHSTEQDNVSGKDSITLLEERLRVGLQEIQSPYYLDLPVYDALRRLPPDRRGIIASVEGVLVLCSFAEDYLKDVWEQRLKRRLQSELRQMRLDKDKQPELGVARSLEIGSARLVSQALFETIRRAQSCVADLTHWPSNVLFELGVRLAASGEHTECLIQSEWESAITKDKPSWLSQCQALVTLLVPTDHRYSATARWNEEEHPFAKVYGPAFVKGTGILAGSVHAAVESALDVSTEPAARPVYQELLDSAELFSRTSGNAGRSKPVGLYPGHAALPAMEEEAEFERLLAAWYYVTHRYGIDGRPSTTEVDHAKAWIAQSLSQRHSLRLSKLPDIERSAITHVARKAAVEAPQPSTLDEIRSVKLWAIAMRNLREFDVAMKLLDDASVVLERMRQDRRIVPALAAEIRGELADTFGIKGGVCRRQDKLHDAYEEYKKGEAIEKIDQQTTYNLSNLIALGVSHERISPLEEEMQQRIKAAIDQLERNTGGARTDEWWAWSDLGQLYLLAGNLDLAAAAYDRARKTGRTAEEYTRHVEMLNQLHAVTSETAPAIAKTIADMLTELSTVALPSAKSGG